MFNMSIDDLVFKRFDNAADLVVVSNNKYAEHVFEKFDNAAELVVVSKNSYAEYFQKLFLKMKTPIVFISYSFFSNVS